MKLRFWINGTKSLQKKSKIKNSMNNLLVSKESKNKFVIYLVVVLF